MSTAMIVTKISLGGMSSPAESICDNVAAAKPRGPEANPDGAEVDASPPCTWAASVLAAVLGVATETTSRSVKNFGLGEATEDPDGKGRLFPRAAQSSASLALRDKRATSENRLSLMVCLAS
jgi:hypothetical protein